MFPERWKRSKAPCLLNPFSASAIPFWELKYRFNGMYDTLDWKGLL